MKMRNFDNLAILAAMVTIPVPLQAAPQSAVKSPAPLVRVVPNPGGGSNDAGVRYYCNSNGSGDCYMNLGDCSEASGENGCFFFEGIINSVDLNNDTPQTLATFPVFLEWVKWLMVARRQAPFTGVGDFASRICANNSVDLKDTSFVINGRLFNSPLSKNKGFQCEKGSGSFSLHGKKYRYRDSNPEGTLRQ
jgi:hypothetical protein